jgi:carboxymethylenebutenolidase
MNRRRLLGGIALAAIARPALSADASQEIEIGSGEDRIILTRYPAPQQGRRPSVILLHGSRGFELRLRAYERHASALTSEGIDAYLARYYTAADTTKMQSFRSSEEREAYETPHYDAWTARVSSVITTILKGEHSSDRIGLLGFSLGGFVAAATASCDSRVSALAVLYGGMPEICA